MELPTSSFTPKLFLKTYQIPNSKTSISPPKFPSFPSRFNFYVHSRKPTKRPNYLRRKLINPQKQVRENPVIYSPISDNVPVIKTDTLVEKRSNLDYDYGINSDDKVLGDSELLNKLESWVQRCKAEAEYWGVGMGYIFTVFEDSNGKVERVEVNEDEIWRRRGTAYKGNEGGEGIDVKSKILYAKELAREMEKGNNSIARDSPVASFVVSSSKPGYVDVVQDGRSSFLNAIRSSIQMSGFVPRMRMVGLMVMMSLVLVGVVKRLFVGGENEQGDLTAMEKEMLRRKLKARAEEEEIVKGRVEVIHKDVEVESEPMEMPGLDREKLTKEIIKAKGYNNEMEYSEHLSDEKSMSDDFGDKIQEIKMMARHARETEKREAATSQTDGEDIHTVNFLGKNEVGNGHVDSLVTSSNGKTGQIEVEDAPAIDMSSDNLVKNGEDLDSFNLDNESPTKKSRVIRSVEEAREYLSRKNVKRDVSHEMKEQDMTFPPSKLDEASQPHSISASLENSESRKPIFIHDENNDSWNDEGENMIDLAGHEHPSTSAGLSPLPKKDNWLEENFHELEPAIKKMREGFNQNYIVAKEAINQDSNSEENTLLPKSEGDSGELSWMKDEKLRDIVFSVRDNELAGREPFHQIDNESKLAFFNGLENKVEEENKRLLNLHKYLHSNIENLDYGADGISLYDPLEKVVPRWKGSPIEKTPDFLSERVDDRIPVVGEDNTISSAPSSISDPSSRVKKGIPKSAKTVIEGSDGTMKVGKKSGKEFWQHTKKWSEGFLSVYNDETDPEVKSVLKDIGKDLDRWITEDEIKKAAELEAKFLEGNQKFLKPKLDRMKREMELFGPQAVVSKYREYSDVKEEDYLWWLDLPYVLCIELYMKEEGEQRTGLYTLEMAPDLELDPKPSHVIAFEDAGDCKSFCYIIQHHLEMIGNGTAFVVARPPKDAFREAKENGFSVTVIRKREVELNVDQPLEEIEELIIEIGSKIYHDKIMQERNVDMSGIIKGLFGATKPSRRGRSKRRLKNPTRQ